MNCRCFNPMERCSAWCPMDRRASEGILSRRSGDLNSSVCEHSSGQPTLSSGERYARLALAWRGMMVQSRSLSQGYIIGKLLGFLVQAPQKFEGEVCPV